MFAPLSQNKYLKDEIDRYDPNILQVGVNFRSYSSRGRKTISKYEVDRILKYYPNPIVEEYTEFIQSSKRIGQSQAKLVRVDSTISGSKYTRKDHLKIEYSEQYPIAVYINKIEQASLREWNYSKKPDYKRKITEYIYTLDYSVLMVRFITNLEEKHDIEYKISLELTSEGLNEQKYALLDKNTYKVIKILYGTAYVYSIDQYFEVVRKFNDLGSSHVHNILNKAIPSQYRHMYSTDLVRGKIIQNPKTIYTVSHLVEGIRMFFMIALNSIWLVKPKNNHINQILPPMKGNIVQLFQRLDGMVLDGVLVSIDAIRRDNRSNYLGYDTIFYIYDILNAGAGKKLNMIEKNYIDSETGKQRYNIKLIELIQRNFSAMYYRIGNNLNYKLYLSKVEQIGIIQNKQLNRAGNPIGGFNYIMASLLDPDPAVVYPIKGLLFKPNQEKYNNSDTIKWVKVYKLKLKVKRVGTEYLLYNKERFIGTQRYTYTNKMLDTNNTLFNKIKSDTVVSFRWDFEILKLVPVKVHLHTTEVDHSKTVKDKWNAIHDNITKETLNTDNNAEFVYYHRDLRSELIINGIKNTNQKVHLIDLNILPSSVVHYERGCKKVIGFVDPNIDTYDLTVTIENIYELPFKIKVINNLSEFNKRLKNPIMLVNRKLFGQVDQLVKRYLDDRLDMVVSFYYLQEWWKSRDTIENNIKNISNLLSGTWIYLIFNGDTLDRNLQGQNNTGLLIEGNHIFKLKKNKVKFDVDLFPEFPYSDPVIYKTHPDDLIMVMQKYGLKLDQNKRCDGRILLNERAYLLSAMFDFGVFSKGIEYKSGIKPKSPYAYVMLIMLGDKYIPGMIAAAYSIKMTGTLYDVVLMHTDELSKDGMKLLHDTNVFDSFILVDKLNYPFTGIILEQYKEMMNSSYTKWNILKLTQYEKVVFIDGDMIITTNIDSVFKMETPAAYFGVRGITERSNLMFGLEKKKAFEAGIIKEYTKIKYPVISGTKVPNDTVWAGLKEFHVLNAGFVLLEPSKEKFEQIIDVISRGNFGYQSKSGADEQIIAYVYLKDADNDSIWTALGPEYNFNVQKPERLQIKADINYYLTPYVIHYTKKSKPWDTEIRSEKQQFLSDKIWMYYFWQGIRKTKLHFNDFKSYFNKSRLNYISRSRSVKRFKYDLSWFDQKVFPWAFNKTAEPKILKGKVKKYAYVYYVDGKNQMPLDALISTISILSTGAGSDLVLYANNLAQKQLDFIRKVNVFNKIIELKLEDEVEARLEMLKLSEYTHIIYLNSSTLAYQLISFLFGLRAPGSNFKGIKYKHGQGISNKVVRDQLNTNYGVDDSLILLEPSLKNYEAAMKVFKSLPVLDSKSTLFEQVITYTFSEGPKLKRNWTYISSNYSIISKNPVKSEETKVRAIHSTTGWWIFKDKWLSENDNLWLTGINSLIKYMEDYQMEAEELKVFGLTDKTIEQIVKKMELSEVSHKN